MVWNHTLRAFIPDNPFILREVAHQQRVTSFLSGFAESVGITTIAICITIAMFICVLNGLDPRFQRKGYVISIQYLAWIFHIPAILRFLMAGVLNGSGDSSLLGSDILMLTPLTNWQLFSGKCWAAMYQVRGWMLALGIVHLGIVFSSGFGQLYKFNWSMTCGNPCVYTIGNLSANSWFAPKQASFIVGSAVVIAVLEMVCCTALGVAVCIVGRSKISLVYTIFLRFVPVFIFSFYPNYSWGFTNEIPLRYSEYTWFSFADGGTSAILQLSDGPSYTRGLLALYVITGLLLLYTGLSVVTALIMIWRSRN